MRALYCLTVVAAFAGCDSGTKIVGAPVEWMEWPAEVLVATPFDVRVVVSRPGCVQADFKVWTRSDTSAVTFLPYFLAHEGSVACLPGYELRAYPSALDTVLTAPALHANADRTFAMRIENWDGESGIQVFGNVTVRLTSPDPSQRNGAGIASRWVDNSGCVRLRPVDTFPESAFVLDDQADTTSFAVTIVHGYFYESAAPICGETHVFHLDARN